MNKLFIIATTLITALLFSSCTGEDPAAMIWEFSSFDNEAVSAVYAPDYVNQVAIAANDDYSGELTLTCTNYPEISIDEYTDDGTFVNVEAGFSITKTDSRTLKIVFTPVANVGEDGIYANVSVSGSNNKERNVTNMSVSRLHVKK